MKYACAHGPHTHEDFHQHIASLIARSGKTQKEIARNLGYTNANIVTMFKNGSTRVPADKVASLAQLLDHPPSALLEAWLRTYMPGFLTDIRTHFQ